MDAKAQADQDAHDAHTRDLRAQVRRGDAEGNTSLHKAAAKGCANEVRILIDIGLADIEARNHQGVAPLAAAAGNGCVATITILLDRGADIAAGHDTLIGWTALMYE